ncbi:hypothetical protein [Pseudomonas arsenicoxydans]|nr:hypothetical protein [Pseudomonas arsenicoxydans]
MTQRNRKRHDDEAGKGKIQVHEGVVRLIQDGDILNKPGTNKKFGLVM